MKEVDFFMMDEDFVYLTQSSLIRNLSKKQFKVLGDISLKLNKLRNCAVEVTSLIKASDGIHYKKINYKSIISEVKNKFNDTYVGIQAHIANAAIKKHVDSFNGFVELMNKIIDQEYDRQVNSPQKHDDDCYHNLIIPKESITSSKKKLAEGYIELPLSREYKKELESADERPRIKIPENILDKKIIQVEIIPINNGEMFMSKFYI